MRVWTAEEYKEHMNNSNTDKHDNNNSGDPTADPPETNNKELGPSNSAEATINKNQPGGTDPSVMRVTKLRSWNEYAALQEASGGNIAAGA